MSNNFVVVVSVNSRWEQKTAVRRKRKKEEEGKSKWKKKAKQKNNWSLKHRCFYSTIESGLSSTEMQITNVKSGHVLIM